jgi:glycine/D-amino acid oxidase-like deaminating enzyme
VAARGALLARQVRTLASAFEKLFGLALPPIAFCWGGSFEKTPDGLPFIGRVPGMHDGLQFALCYGGNGICFALQSSEMIRDGVEGRPHALDRIFGSAEGRWNPGPWSNQSRQSVRGATGCLRAVHVTIIPPVQNFFTRGAD